MVRAVDKLLIISILCIFYLTLKLKFIEIYFNIIIFKKIAFNIIL